MNDILSNTFVISLIAGAVAAGIPLLFAGLGEQVSEKSGVLNIGIEGMMLFGAYAGFSVAFTSGSLWLGFLSGASAGMFLALLMVLFCVRLGLNQIVVGIALTLGAEGFTALLHHVQFSRTYPRLPKVESVDIPGLSQIPILGPSMFSRHPSVYISVIFVVVIAYLFRHTNIGLNLQAAGDKPDALDAAGVSVSATRTWSVLFAGLMAGIGGAYMSMIGAGIFVPFMTGGAGFIAIVLAMLARGRPLLVLVGAFLFGTSLSLTTALQVGGIKVPTDIVQMLPFLMVMVVLVIFARRSSLPAALGLPYVRGQR